MPKTYPITVPGTKPLPAPKPRQSPETRPSLPMPKQPPKTPGLPKPEKNYAPVPLIPVPPAHTPHMSGPGLPPPPKSFSGRRPDHPVPDRPGEEAVAPTSIPFGLPDLKAPSYRQLDPHGRPIQYRPIRPVTSFFEPAPLGAPQGPAFSAVNPSTASPAPAPLPFTLAPPRTPPAPMEPEVR